MLRGDGLCIHLVFVPDGNLKTFSCTFSRASTGGGWFSGDFVVSVWKLPVGFGTFPWPMGPVIGVACFVLSVTVSTVIKRCYFHSGLLYILPNREVTEGQWGKRVGHITTEMIGRWSKWIMFILYKILNEELNHNAYYNISYFIMSCGCHTSVLALHPHLPLLWRWLHSALLIQIWWMSIPAAPWEVAGWCCSTPNFWPISYFWIG